MPCHIRHLPKNKFKNTLLKSLFDILNSEDNYIDMPTFFITNQGKISQKSQKLNSSLLISTFTIYLFYSFFFNV